MAQKLAENANCVRDTSEEMVKCLREKEPSGIINAQLKLSVSVNQIFLFDS